MMTIVSQFPLCNYRAVPSGCKRDERSDREGRGSIGLTKILPVCCWSFLLLLLLFLLLLLLFLSVTVLKAQVYKHTSVHLIRRCNGWYSHWRILIPFTIQSQWYLSRVIFITSLFQLWQRISEERPPATEEGTGQIDQKGQREV